MNVLLIIVIGAILEIAVWIGIAQFISGWYVFFWFIIAFFIGFSLLRSSAASIMPQLQQMQATGQMGMDPVVSKKLALVMAGILLMIPGVLSDILAALIMIPAVRRMVQAALMNAMLKRQQAMMNKMMGGMMGGGSGASQNPFEDLMRQMQNQQQGQNRSSGSNVIDGEAREVTPDTKKIEQKNQNHH